MASTVHFKFVGYDTDQALDTVPDDLSEDISAATFQTFLADLYDNYGGDAACGSGKVIFGNADDGINAPVLQVAPLIVHYPTGEGETDKTLLFYLRNLSATFRIAP
jgi:hypothetical protein